MTSDTPERRPDVAVFYFPGWHTDPRNDVWKQPGFTEWELVRQGRPRFEGHHQPLIPDWGYFDESDPDVMRRATATAAAHGVNAFLFDWYWYDGADFLNGALDRGYLPLDEPGVSFALHWANHDWTDVFPARADTEPPVLTTAAVTPDEFAALTDVIIERYLRHPAYWRIDGAAYFSWHQFGLFVDWMGGWDGVREVLDSFRVRARAAGVGELHLTAVGGIDIPGGDGSRLAAAGIDSFTPYNWLHVLPLDRGLQVPYADWRHLADADARASQTAVSVPFAPNVTMGWDSTTRVHQDDAPTISTWPRLPVVVDNSPDEFGDAVSDALTMAVDTHAPYVTVNAWNEWTEGSYLEPEHRTGTSYLQALHAAVRQSS